MFNLPSDAFIWLLAFLSGNLKVTKSPSCYDLVTFSGSLFTKIEFGLPLTDFNKLLEIALLFKKSFNIRLSWSDALTIQVKFIVSLHSQKSILYSIPEVCVIITCKTNAFIGNS